MDFYFKVGVSDFHFEMIAVQKLPIISFSMYNSSLIHLLYIHMQLRFKKVKGSMSSNVFSLRKE